MKRLFVLSIEAFIAEGSKRWDRNEYENPK